MEPSARNMPVDSIITTTMISDMVRIIMMSKRGMPKWKGSTMSNQAAWSIFSKVMMPAAEAAMAPTTMPSSTEILATKPRAYLTMSRMDSSTTAAMPRPTGSAYFGWAPRAGWRSPAAGGAWPPGAVTSASHLA